jgi:hypothetical protein
MTKFVQTGKGYYYHIPVCLTGYLLSWPLRQLQRNELREPPEPARCIRAPQKAFRPISKPRSLSFPLQEVENIHRPRIALAKNCGNCRNADGLHKE